MLSICLYALLEAMSKYPVNIFLVNFLVIYSLFEKNVRYFGYLLQTKIIPHSFIYEQM